MTQTVKASELTDLRHYGPLFIDDGSPQGGVNGPARFARKVQTVNDCFGSVRGDYITVEFADGTPAREFEVDEDVVVHNILPGADLKS
ncbi:hypothetical protein ACNQR9_24785 [Mycolicibacterium peregrinum]